MNIHNVLCQQNKKICIHMLSFSKRNTRGIKTETTVTIKSHLGCGQEPGERMSKENKTSQSIQ